VAIRLPVRAARHPSCSFGISVSLFGIVNIYPLGTA
jgi:hypothetical protein